MNSANHFVEKTAFTEKELEGATYLPTSTTSTAHELKAKEDELRSVRMSRLQHFCFALILLALLAVTAVTAVPGQIPVPAEEKSFQELLASVEPAALHNILHEHFKDKYQHGVYPEDKTAMEVVHKQNAEVASSLVELAKRQGGSGSNGTVRTSSSVTPTVSDTPTPTPTPTPSQSPSNTPVSTPSPTPTITPPTSFSTSSRPPSSTSSPSSTPSQTPSATTSSASSPTTPGPSRSPHSSTQTIVYTTTLPDGGAITVTSITVVQADQPAPQGNGGGTSIISATPSLQSDSASTLSRQFGLSMGVGVLGVAVAWVI